MNTYFAHEVINISGGNVVLDKDQARRRKHNIKENGDGTFAVIKPIQFKKGEKFGSDIEVNRRLAETLSDENGTPMAEVQAQADAEKAESETNESNDDDSTDVSYEDMNKDTLKAELDYRGIEYLVNDTRTALIGLLDKDDASQSTDE